MREYEKEAREKLGIPERKKGSKITYGIIFKNKDLKMVKFLTAYYNTNISKLIKTLIENDYKRLQHKIKEERRRDEQH